ncbi:MAG: 50S ribosomal protein L23 [Candidatus Peregrinibacteria bacterium]
MIHANPIIRTIVTEKASNKQADGQYTFEVRRDSTKISIKKAIKLLYGVDADTVKIIISPKKKRLLAKGRVWTKRRVMKKAVVTLKGKKTIDPNKIKEPKK